MRHPWLALLVALVVPGTLLPDSRPTPGGVLRIAQRAEPRTFNPLIATDAPSREVLRRIHADLISIDRASGRTVPNLAASWTLSKDGTLFRLKLRPGLRFSDGQPFTADDVVASFEAILDQKTLSPQRDLLIIDGQPIRVTRVDDLTVEARLPQPYAAAERLFDSVPMLPRRVLRDAQKSGKIRELWSISTPVAQVVGLGPFRLKEYKPGERIVVERNPYYWRSPRPWLDGIEFRLIPSEDTQLARFVAGELDILNRLDPAAVRFLESKGGQVQDAGPSLEFNFVAFNLSPDSPKLAWFAKQEFRRAVSLAIDRAGLARVVYQGRGTPLWTQVSPGSAAWFSPSLPRPARSVDQAKALLSRAGFRWNGSDLVDTAGKPVEFSILVSASSAERQRMASMVQSDLGALGIRLQVVPLEFRSMLDRVLRTRQFDTCLLGLGGGDDDPNSEMNVWLSSEGMHLWNPSQKQPATSWEAEIDSLMRRQMTTLDPKQRRRLYQRVQEILAEQSPLLFLASPHVVVAAQPRVRNFRPARLDHYTLWNADELYLDSAGRR